MNKLKKILLASSFVAVTAAAALSFAGVASADSAKVTDSTDPNCSVHAVGDDHTTSMFNIANGKATVTVVVEGDANCTETVSMASWKAPYGVNGFTPLDQQTLVDSTTQVLGVGTHTLTLNVPDCMFQVDLTASKNPTYNGTAHYVAASKLFAWIQFGDKVCEQPTPTPTPTPQTPITTAPAPTQLVNTGPGQVFGIFAAVAVLGAAVHSFVIRKFAR